MTRAALDTNVLVSGFAEPNTSGSVPGAIIRYWRNATFERIVSPSILTEFERATAKPYFASRRSPQRLAAALRLLPEEATNVVPTVTIAEVAPHPADDLVLAAVVSAGVDYRVTEDKRFRSLATYGGVRLVTPREFLSLLESASEGETLDSGER